MSSRKSKDKDRSDRKSRGDSTKTLIEVAPLAFVDQQLPRSVSNQQQVLRRGESDDYYNPRPDTLPGPGPVESPTHYNGGPPPNQPLYGGAPPPGQISYSGATGSNQAYDGGPPGSQHNGYGSGHGGYTGGGPIYHAGYGEPAPAHYSQHAGAKPPIQQGASADYYHGSGSYSNPGPPLQQSGSYGGGGALQGQENMPGAFPPNLQHTQSAPPHGYPATGYQQPVLTQGQKPPRRDSSSSSSSSSYVDISRNYPLPPVRKTPLGAIRMFFTAPSESRRRVIRRKSSRTLREQRRQGRLAQGRTRSASSSEADSDLAYGSGYLRRRKRRGSRGSRSPGGRWYQHSRSPRRNGYGSPGRRQSIGRDKVDGKMENYHPATAGGVPLPGLSHANTMPGSFPIETLATAGAAGAIAAGLSRKDNKKGKKDAELEILKLGEDLHNLAKRQNKYDLEEAAKRGRFNVVRHNEGRHGLGPKGFGVEGTTRGIPSSKPQKPKEDDGWETSDSDDTSSSSESADSAMAFGGENTYQNWKWREPNHPPRSAQSDSHQGQARERDQKDQHYPRPPTRKSTIVDPKLFGPQNSLLGVVERPVGFGSIDDLRGDGATPLDPPTVKQTGYFRSPLSSPKPAQRNRQDIRRDKEEERKRSEEPILMRDGSSRQRSTTEMQHVFPMPTDDPGFVDVARATPEKRPSFHARTDSLPLRQPKPMSPVRREVYDSAEVSDKKGRGKGKEKESSTRSHDLALGALAGGAIAAAVAAGMSSTEIGTKGTGKSKVPENEQDREIDSQRMFRDDMARRNGRRPETRPDRRDSYGLSGSISAVSPAMTRDGKVDPFQFQVNDDAWDSNGGKKGRKSMPAHERMAARAAGSFRDSGSSTPRKYVEDVARDKEREREYQEQLYSSSPEMLRQGDSELQRPLERTVSGRILEREIKPLHERIATRAAESNPDTGRFSPRTGGLPSSSASALDEEAERRIREVVQKWGILGRKSTGFADVVLAARKAELEKVEPVYTPPAPEIKMVERTPKWASERDVTERAESPPRWHRGDEPESPAIALIKGEEEPLLRRKSSDADHRYASMHDDYFSSKERPREIRRGRSRTRSPSPPTRGRSPTRSRSAIRGRSPSPEIRDVKAPKDHDRRPHNTEHEFEEIQKEVEDFTAPYPVEDIQAAIAAEHADQQRHPHDPNHQGHDNVQEDADRYWREAELARKLAKQHSDDKTARVVTPPAMVHHSRDKSEEEKKEDDPYPVPDADFRFDHEMHPHELPLFTPVALRKSFSLPEDFDDSQPFDPSLLGLKRPLLNIVRATPKPDENAKVVQLKEPRSRSQSRERKPETSETSRSAFQDEDKPTYGKPVTIEDELSSPPGEIVNIPAIVGPVQEAEKSVSWGQNDTQTYVPVTPHYEERDPHDGTIPSNPESTRAAQGGEFPYSHAFEQHKEVEYPSDFETMKKDKGKGNEKVREAKAVTQGTPEKRPKPKSLWSRFTPDLAKRIQEREEFAYNLANASTIGFADGDEGREVPRDEVAELALERGRRFQDPEAKEHKPYQRAEDPELKTGESFEYKGVVVEPEAPNKHKKKSRKNRERTPSPPTVGPKPTPPSESGRMPGSFDSDAEVAFAHPRGISPPASDVSTVIYHNPAASELSDSMAGIATGFNSEIGARPRGIEEEEGSFVDVSSQSRDLGSDESFEIVDKQPEQTMVVTVEPSGEPKQSFAVVDNHSSMPSEETQPLIVDEPNEEDDPLGYSSAGALEMPAIEAEGFVTPLAEVVTPFYPSEVGEVPAPQILDAAPLGGTEQDPEKSIDAAMEHLHEVDTTAPNETSTPESTSQETEASSSSQPKKKKKKKGEKGAAKTLEADPEIIADTPIVEDKEIRVILKDAVSEPEPASFSNLEETEAQKTGEQSKEIVVELATPATEDTQKTVQGESSKTDIPLAQSAEVVASEITEPSRSIEPSASRDDESTEQPRDVGLADEFIKSDSTAEAGRTSELGGTSSGVAALDVISTEDVAEAGTKEAKQKKSLLFDSDFAAVALAGTVAAVAGITNALIPGSKEMVNDEPKIVKEMKEDGLTDVGATKESKAESWIAPEMPTGMNKKAKKAWTQKVAKEKEEFVSAQASREVRDEHWSAPMMKSKNAPQDEVADTPAMSAPDLKETSKDVIDAPLKGAKETIDAPIQVTELTPEAIKTAGEAGEYYDPPADALALSNEPAVERSKDITDPAPPAPTEEVIAVAPGTWQAPEMPAGLNKKGKKAWSQKMAKEREEWEVAQVVAAQTSETVEKKPIKIVEESKDVAEFVVEGVDTPVSVIGAPAPITEEASKDVDVSAESVIETSKKPIEIIEATTEIGDTSSSSADIVEESGKDITNAATSIADIADIVDAPTEVVQPIPEVYSEPEMPTGLNKKQKTAWKKKVAKEREEFESAQASKAASATASGSQTPADVVEEDNKDTAKAPIASTTNVETSLAAKESLKEDEDVDTVVVEEGSKEIIDAPIEVLDADVPVIVNVPAASNVVVEENSNIGDVAAQLNPETVHTPTSSTPIVEECSKDITSDPSSPPAEVTSAPILEIYEEPIMPAGLNKKQKQAWKKKVAKEKEEWESARSSAEQSAKESGEGLTTVVAEATKAIDEPSVVEEAGKEVEKIVDVAAVEMLDEAIIEPVQPLSDTVDPQATSSGPPTEQPVSDEPASMVVNATSPVLKAGIENFQDAVTATNDATSEPSIVDQTNREEAEPAPESVIGQTVTGIIETPLATPTTPLEAAAAKALADEEAAAIVTSATAEVLETPQFEVPEVLPTPVFEDESGAFASEPPETPLVTPLPTPIEVEQQASDSPTEDEAGVVSLSMEDAAALAASDLEAQAADVSLSIEDASALASLARATDMPTRKLSKKEKKAAEKAARARELEWESSTVTEERSVPGPVHNFRDLANVPGTDSATPPLEAALETPAIETPAAEAEVSLGGNKKKKKKGKEKAADRAGILTPLEAPSETPLETSATGIAEPTVEKPTAEPVVEHDPVAETLALLGGITHSRAIPPSSIQTPVQSIEPVLAAHSLESPTDDDDAFHSAAEDRARSATPTGTVDDDDFHSTNGEGAWHSPRMNGHDQPDMVPEMAKEPEATEMKVIEDESLAPVKGKKKKKKKGKGAASGSSSAAPEGEMSEGAQESFLANAGTLGAGVGSAAAGPRDMNSGILESEERNADVAGKRESQPRSLRELVESDNIGEEKDEGTVVGYDEGRDVLAGQTLIWESKKEVVSDPVEETKRVLEGIEHSTGTKERRVVSDPLLNDPEIIKREVMPSIDPQFGDLLPLPPKDSPPNEEVDCGALVTDLPPTPADAPASFQSLGSIQEQAEPSPPRDEIMPIDPEIHPRSIRPAIDPQFGDLLELPPSQPGSPLRQVEDDAISMQLPESPPESPALSRTSLDGVRERESPQTPAPKKKDKTFAGRSPSVNAVPLKFLLGGRSSSNSSPSSPVAGSATSPTRTKSRHSWDSSKGLQPLTLLSSMERRHSRGSSLAENESSWLAPLLEAAAQDKDNISTADIAANTAVKEQAVKTGGDGEGTDVSATAACKKKGEEYLPEAIPASVEVPSAAITDAMIAASSAELVNEATKGIIYAGFAPESYVEPEMPIGLNKKQKTAWKKKVAKEREEWESARSSSEQSDSQPPVQDAPVEVFEPTSQVVKAPAAIAEQSSNEVADTPIEAGGVVPQIIDAPPQSTDVLEKANKDIIDAPINAPTELVLGITETPGQSSAKDTIHTPPLEEYSEPEIPAGLNKKQKTAWRKKIAKEKEQWESARSAQSSAKQSSGGWTDEDDQKSREEAAGPVVKPPIAEASSDMQKDIEATKPNSHPTSRIIEPQSILVEAEPASREIDLDSVLQQIPAAEAATTGLDITSIEPVLGLDNTPAVDETTHSAPEIWQEPEMPTGLNKKQKTAWKKKVAKDREEWESAQSSTAQSGDQPLVVIDTSGGVVKVSAPVSEEPIKENVIAPTEGSEAIIDASSKIVEGVSEKMEAVAPSEAIVDDSGSGIMDEPAQPANDVADPTAIEEVSQPAAVFYQEPEMPIGLNSKQKKTWKKKVAQEREDWESAQSSASAAEAQAVQGTPLAVDEDTAKMIEKPPEVADVPSSVLEETSKNIVDDPSAAHSKVIVSPIEILEHTSEPPIIQMGEAAGYYNEDSKDAINELIEPTTPAIPEVISENITQPISEVYQEPEMPSGLNKKQKTAWKKNIAKEREEFESSQASAATSGFESPVLKEASRDIADLAGVGTVEVVETKSVQKTPSLEIGGFIETPVAEIPEPILIEQEPIIAPMKNTRNKIAETSAEVVSNPAFESAPEAVESQPAKKLNKKQKIMLAKKVKEEAGSASASVSGGWTDSDMQALANDSFARPMIEEAPAQVIPEQIVTVEEPAPTPEQPSSGSIRDFEKSDECAKQTGGKVDANDITSFEKPAEPDTTLSANIPLLETQIDVTGDATEIKEAEETNKDIIYTATIEPSNVFVSPEMPPGLKKKQQKAWEKKVQKEREEWKSVQASKEKSAAESKSAPSGTVEKPSLKNESIDLTIYDVSDPAEQPGVRAPENVEISALGPQTPAIALPVYEDGGEAASYPEDRAMHTPPRAASPASKPHLSQTQAVDDEQVSESAGEMGDVDSSAFEAPSKKTKKKKKGKEVAVEPTVVEVQSPVQEKSNISTWADELDDDGALGNIAAPTMLPAIVKDAFSRPQSPELKVSDAPSGKKSKKKKVKRAAVGESETPVAAEPSTESIALPMEHASETPFEGHVDKTLPDVSEELKASKDVDAPASSIQLPLESDPNDSPPTPDAVRETIALLSGISHTRESLIKTSAQRELLPDVADEAIAIDQPAAVEDVIARINEQAFQAPATQVLAPAIIEMPVMPKGLNKRQKKAWEKKNATLVAEAVASQAASAAPSGSQSPAIKDPAFEIAEGSVNKVVDTQTPDGPDIEDPSTREVLKVAEEFMTEPSLVEENEPTLEAAPLPEVLAKVLEAPIEAEIVNEIPLTKAPLETPTESAFESASSKKTKKKGKKAATVEVETNLGSEISSLPADAANVLELQPTSDTTKDVKAVYGPPANNKDAVNEASVVEALLEIQEEPITMVDTLEAPIASSVPTAESSGNTTPAEPSIKTKTTAVWEEPEMPKGLNKKKKAEWKKKMAKEKEEWESAQASTIHTPAEIVQDAATLEKSIEGAMVAPEYVEEIDPPPVVVGDTSAEAPPANISEEPATITDDYGRSIPRNVTLPDSALATLLDSESPFESPSSKNSKEKKGKEDALVAEEKPSSRAPEVTEESPKETNTPEIDVVNEAKEAIIEPDTEANRIVEAVAEPLESVGEAHEYKVQASKDATELPAELIAEAPSAPAVEEVAQPPVETWEEPIMPTGLNKKKKDAWKKKVAKQKAEWESAQASKVASSAESDAQSSAVQDTPVELVEENKKNVHMADVVPIPTPFEEPKSQVVDEAPIETPGEIVMKDAPTDQDIVVEEIAKYVPLPETPMETTESSTFESQSSSKSKKKKKGKKGTVSLGEEPASPAPDVVEDTLKESSQILEVPIEKSVDIPTKEHISISEPVLHDAIVEAEHPSTPPTIESVDVSVKTHEGPTTISKLGTVQKPAAETISADTSAGSTPFVSISIDETCGSSDRTPDPEKTDEPMERMEAPKTAFLEHSASGNGSSLPREMEEGNLVSVAGAGGVENFGEKEDGGESGEVVDEMKECDMPSGLNKNQKKAWKIAEKKRVKEALAAADAKASEHAAEVEVGEISKDIVDEPVVDSGETPVAEKVEDESKPTGKLSEKERKAADKKDREDEEEAEIEAAAKKEQKELGAVEEPAEALLASIGAVGPSLKTIVEPDQAVNNIERPRETPSEDEWTAPTRKLSKKEQKPADKKRGQDEEKAEADVALKCKQERIEAEAILHVPTIPIIEEGSCEMAEQPASQEAGTAIESPAEDEWAATRKLSKKEKKALDINGSDADEKALIDQAAAATATAATIATATLVTGGEPSSELRELEEPPIEKPAEEVILLENSSRTDSGNESPPANTKVKRKDKGKGKAIDIADEPFSAGPTTPIERQERFIPIEEEPPRVMNVHTTTPDRGIFEQALEKVVEKQVQQRDLQDKVQENITAQAVKGSWSFSSLEDDGEENTPWSASRLPPVLEEDVVLEHPRTPDNAIRSRSPIYRGIDKEDSAFVEGAESMKSRPRSWFDPEYVRDSGVLLREKKSSDSQKSFSERANTDDALIRRSWPLVDDEKEVVDLRLKKRSSLKESKSSPYEKITPKDIAKAATGLGIASSSKRSLSKSPALSESPSREFLLRKANRSQTSSSDEKHSSSSSRQPSALPGVGRSETPRSASERQHQRQSSLLEPLHDSPRSFSDNINNPRTRTPSGISREEYYNRGFSATPTSDRGLGSALSRPGSVISDRSITPSLRRVSGRASTDLRALSQKSQSEAATQIDAKTRPPDDSGSASDNSKPGPSHQGDNTKDKNINTSDVSAASNSKPPAPNEGKKRVKGMAEVYNGFGEGRIGSPRSPTRPHSMRRKQSMQLLDLQAQMAAMAEELAAARQEKAVILQAKEAAERNLDEARREAGKAQQYKAQVEEVRGLLETMTLKNTDLTRQTLDLQAQIEERDNSAQATIAATVAAAIADKEQELVQLRQRAERLSHDWSGDEREIEELEAIIANQKVEIASLKQSRSAAASGPEYLAEYARDDAYFEQSCQKLFRGVWRWIHAFSDRRKHSLSSLEDIKSLEDPRIYQWMKDAFTGNPSHYLADLDKRRLILMGLTMSLFHHYIFSKHFFGLTKDQQEASKVLEMVVDDSDISDGEFRLWRATQFCLFSKSRNYIAQRNHEVLGVTDAVMRKLSDVLPQPSSSASDDQRTDILNEELKIIVKKAAELSNDMRRQSTKYSWRQSERALWGEKRIRTLESFEAGKMTHAEICVQFMELHRVDEKLSDTNISADARAGLERERQQHIGSLIQDLHVVSESEVVPGWKLSWEEMVRRMEEKNRRIEEKGMSVRLSLFPMVVKEGDEGKTVIWKSVVKPVDLKSGIPSASGKRRAGGESSVGGGSEHGSKHPRMR